MGRVGAIPVSPWSRTGSAQSSLSEHLTGDLKLVARAHRLRDEHHAEVEEGGTCPPVGLDKRADMFPPMMRAAQQTPGFVSRKTHAPGGPRPGRRQREDRPRGVDREGPADRQGRWIRREMEAGERVERVRKRARRIERAPHGHERLERAGQVVAERTRAEVGK